MNHPWVQQMSAAPPWRGKGCCEFLESGLYYILVQTTFPHFTV